MFIIYDNVTCEDLMEMGESLDECKWSSYASNDINGDIFYETIPLPHIFKTIEEAKEARRQLIQWTEEQIRIDNGPHAKMEEYAIEFIIYVIQPRTTYWLGEAVNCK